MSRILKSNSGIFFLSFLLLILSFFLFLLFCLLRLIYEFYHNLKPLEIAGRIYTFTSLSSFFPFTLGCCEWNFLTFFTMSVGANHHVPLISAKDQLALFLIDCGHTLCALVREDSEHDRAIVKNVIHSVANTHKSIVLHDVTMHVVNLCYKVVSASCLLLAIYSVCQLKGILQELAVYHTNQSAVPWKFILGCSLIKSIYQFFLGINPLLNILFNIYCFLSLVKETEFYIFLHIT